jgi:ankyrin repeat protein
MWIIRRFRRWVMENLGEELLEACLSDIDQAEWLISRYADPNILNWQDLKCHNSILHMVVYQNLHLSTELLLNSGSDPNIANKVVYKFPSFYYLIADLERGDTTPLGTHDITLILDLSL